MKAQRQREVLCLPVAAVGFAVAASVLLQLIEMEKLGAQHNRMASAAVLVAVMLLVAPACAVDYHDAMVKSIQYFEAQRSGRLTGTERFSWRGNSGLSDGASQGVRYHSACASAECCCTQV